MGPVLRILSTGFFISCRYNQGMRNRVAKVVLPIAVVFIVAALISGYMVQAILVPSAFVLKGLHTVGWNSALEQLFHAMVALGKWNDKTFHTSFIRENMSLSIDQGEKRIIRLLKTDVTGPFNWRLYSVGEYKSTPFAPLPRPPLFRK